MNKDDTVTATFDRWEPEQMIIKGLTNGSPWSIELPKSAAAQMLEAMVGLFNLTERECRGTVSKPAARKPSRTSKAHCLTCGAVYTDEQKDFVKRHRGEKGEIPEFCTSQLHLIELTTAQIDQLGWAVHCAHGSGWMTDRDDADRMDEAYAAIRRQMII